MVLRSVEENEQRGPRRFERLDQQHASLAAERTAVLLRAVRAGRFLRGLSDGHSQQLAGQSQLFAPLAVGQEGQPLVQLGCRAARFDGRVGLGLSDRPSRHLGL